MEFSSDETNYNKESILPDVAFLMEIKTEPEIVTEHDKERDINCMLREIIQGQKEINERLDKIEQNQITILENQSILSNGQSVIVSNCRQIADKIKKIEFSTASKPEMLAQTKTLMECNLSIKRVEQYICNSTSESYDEHMVEIAKILPLQTLEAVAELEEKLKTPEFTVAMFGYLYKMKGTSEDVGSVIRSILTDDLLDKYNWDGRWEKQSLGKLILFDRILRDVFQQGGAYEYEKSVKKAVERSHHRVNQKKYIKK